MLGRRVCEVLRQSHEVTATARRADDADDADGVRALDVTDAAAVRAAVAAVRPAVIVNCAGYTAVDKAEAEPDVARSVNATAAGVLAEAAAAANALIVHVSSDFVFDGLKRTPYVETDAVNPQSAYARSKEGGERLVRAAAGRHVILRTQWLYGPDGKHFPATILRLARQGRPLRVVADQVGSPTYAPDVARAIGDVIRAGITGTVHAANRGEASWHEFAVAILARAGEGAPVEPITAAEFNAPARRPPYSVLRNAVLEATIGDVMRPWEEALLAFAQAGGLSS